MRHVIILATSGFLAAVEAYHEWMRIGGKLPTVTFERRYVPHQISIAEACGLVWNCTDLMPGSVMDHLVGDLGLPARSGTYAAVARAMLAHLQARGPTPEVTLQRRA